MFKRNLFYINKYFDFINVKWVYICFILLEKIVKIMFLGFIDLKCK